MPIKVDITRAKRRLKEIADRANDLPWNDVSEIMSKSIIKNFDLGGRYGAERSFEGGSRKWQRRKNAAAHPLLVKTGALKNKIQYNVGSNNLEIKSSLPYSAAQQFGFPDKNLPSRPFITIQKDDIKDIATLFRRHLSK